MNNMTLKQEACIMLFTYNSCFSFFCRSEKGLLNFICERIKLVYRINLLGTAFKKKYATFQTSKTTIYRPYTYELVHI